MILTINGIASDEGTIVLFTTEEGPTVAVDHRPAQDIAYALFDGETPRVEAESWQILGGVR